MIKVEESIPWTDSNYINQNNISNISGIFEYNWTRNYLRLTKVVHDNGTDFTGWEFQSILETYQFESNPITVKT